MWTWGVDLGGGGLFGGELNERVFLEDELRLGVELRELRKKGEGCEQGRN